MLYTIYKITNIINGKYYLGKHITNNLEDNYYGSGTAIKQAISKYGKQNFLKEVLFILPSEQEMNEKEKELLSTNIINDPKCYNMKPGGIGGSYKGINQGTQWINNSIENKKINIGDIIPEGWVLGFLKNVIDKSNPGGKKSKGKYWITNGFDSSMISPTDAIPEGWYKGRNNNFKNNKSIFIKGGQTHKNTSWITNGIQK